MLIKSVAVRSYRTIRHAKVDFTAGLNVIYGDNDIGKSTLIDALRAGLVRPGRLSGKVLASMYPHDGGHPEVDVCFELAGDEYTVHKKFASNGSTRLYRRSGGGGVLREITGDPDEELTHLLRFGERRTARGATDLGILPLIWVTQGASGLAPSEVMAGEAGTALSMRLAEIGGSAFDGAGTEHLFDRVRAEYERHFTPGRCEPRTASPLFLAREDLKRAEAEVKELYQRRTELDAIFAERQRCERERRELAERLPVLERARETARATWEQARSLLAQRAAAASEGKALRLEAQAARDRLTGRRATQSEMAELRRMVEIAARAAEDAAERLRMHDAGRQDLARHVDATATEERAAERRLRVAQARVELLQESGALAVLERRLAEAESIERRVANLHEQLGGMRIRPEDLERLSKLELDAEKAAAALKAVAASVEIVALRDGPIGIDAELSQLRAGQHVNRQVVARTVVRVGNIAEIVVNPGGSSLATAREAANTKQSAFRRALEQASVANVADARAAVEARRVIEGAIAVANAKLGAVAPSGVPTLREECAAQRAKTKAAQSLLDGADAAAPSGESIDEARANAKAADGVHQAARTAWVRAQAVLARHDAQRAELLAARDVAESQVTGTRQRLTDLETAHARSIERDGSDVVFEERARAAEVVADEADRNLATLAARIAELDPEVARNRAEAADRARDTARAEGARLEKEIHGLDARLDQAEVLDADDRLEIAEAHLARAKKTEERRAEEAEGVRLLYETLRACREEAQATFLAPLTSEVQRLARQLDPTSKVALDATYGVQLERAAFGSHSFQSLGGGCKEQIATVVRLAMAGILAGDGVLPVLFDDAMVNTSNTRFDRMADVLLGMASRLQIIVFTCHWERYAALGAHNVVDLGRVRAQLEVPARAVAAL